MMIRQFQRRRALGWLAVLAMLLLALVPTVSQFVDAHSSHHAHGSAVSAGFAHVHHHDAGSAQDRSGDDCWHKCGYCDFLAHTPLLGMVAPIGLVGTAQPFVPAAARILQPRYAHTLQIAQPRGPPVVLV
jgi:hypothetical protein